MMNDEDAKKFWKQMERLQKLTKNDKVHGQHNDGFKTSKLTNINSDGQYVNEITFPDWSKYRWVKDNMEQLRKDLFTFDQLKLPDFSVSYDESQCLITIKKQFIRGEIITNDRKWAEIIWRELVDRKSEYTFSSLHYHNFRVDSRGELYYIDLDDYKKIPHDKRVDTYNRFYSRSTGEQQ